MKRKRQRHHFVNDQEEGVAREFPSGECITKKLFQEMGLDYSFTSDDGEEFLKLAKHRSQMLSDGGYPKSPPEKLSGWFPRNHKFLSGGGFFWELLQEAWGIKQELECCDPEEKKLLQEDLLYLVQHHFTEFLQNPIVVSKFKAIRGNHKSHGDLQDAIHFLLLLSDVAAETDVQVITRILFCKNTFVNFSQSDPIARAIMLCGGFRLIDGIRHHGLDVTDACAYLVDWLGILLDEIDTLNILLMRPMDYSFVEETTLPWNRVMFDSQEANIDYFEMLRNCDHLLLKTMLSHMQRLCFSLSEASDASRGEFVFGTTHLEKIINLKLGRETPFLEEGLKLAYVLIAVAERENRGEALRAIMPLFSEVIGSKVDKLFNAQLLDSSSRLQGVDVTNVQRQSKMIPLMAMFLAKLHGIRASFGLCDWLSILHYTLQPNGVNPIWDSSNTISRKTMLLYLAHALESGVFDINSPSTRQNLIHIWMRSLVELDCQKEVAYLGIALSTNQRTKQLIPMSVDMASLADNSCVDIRIRISQHVQSAIEPGHDILDKLEKVVAKRDQDLAQQGLMSARSDRLAWHLRAASIMLPSVIGTRHKLGGSFLLVCCKWVFEALKTFHQIYFEQSNNGPHSIRVSTRANVAKGLQHTCLRLLPEIFSVFSCLGAPQLLEKNPDGSHMRAFSMLMSAFLDLPMVPNGPHPVDLVSLEALAIALTSTGSLIGANLHQASLYGDNSLLIKFILHYCAGESFEKSFMSTPKSDRYAMNNLYFMQYLFTQRAAKTRSGLCGFVPWVLGPMIKILFPDQGRLPSVACKIRLYKFLQFFFQNPDVSVLAPPECNTVLLTGEVDSKTKSLYSDLQVEYETLEKGLQVLLVVCMRHMVSSVRELIPTLKRGAADELLAKDKGSLFIPMEAGTTSAKIAAGQAQTSLSVLYGRLVRNAIVSGKLRKQIIPQFSGLENAASTKEALAKESLMLLKTLVTTSAKGVTWAMPALPVLKQLLLKSDQGSNHTSTACSIYGQILDGIGKHGLDVRHLRLGTTASDGPHRVSSDSDQGMSRDSGHYHTHQKRGDPNPQLSSKTDRMEVKQENE